MPVLGWRVADGSMKSVDGQAEGVLDVDNACFASMCALVCVSDWVSFSLQYPSLSVLP